MRLLRFSTDRGAQYCADPSAKTGPLKRFLFAVVAKSSSLSKTFLLTSRKRCASTSGKSPRIWPSACQWTLTRPGSHGALGIGTQPDPGSGKLAKDRKEILDTLARFQAQQGLKRAAVDKFVELFRAHEVPGLDPAMYEAVPRISRSQLYAWQKAYENEGIAGLIARYGHSRGTTSVPIEQQKFLRALLTDKPHLTPSKLVRSVQGPFQRRGPQDQKPFRSLSETRNRPIRQLLRSTNRRTTTRASISWLWGALLRKPGTSSITWSSIPRLWM